MAQSKATTAVPNQKPAGNKRMMVIIISALAAVLILLAGAVGYLFLNKHNQNGEDGPTPGAPGTLPVFEKMDAFVINLSGEQGGMLQVEMETELSAESSREIVKAYTPKIRSAIIMLLSSKSAQELSSAEGKAKLRNQVRKIINETIGASPDRPLVVGVVFTSFIVQQ